MGVDKTLLLVNESIHWININTDVEIAIKHNPVYLEFQVAQPKGKMLSDEIPGRLWECVGADIF